MSVNNKQKYYCKILVLENSIIRYPSVTDFAKKCDLDSMTVYNALRGLRVSETTVKKICKELNMKVDELFIKEDNDFDEREVNEFKLSDEIIKGLKNNIENRLSQYHRVDFINEILNIVDNIIIESSNLGLIAYKYHKEEYIRLAIQKRRKKDDTIK